MSTEERVMVFPAEILEKIGKPNLFSKDTTSYLTEIFKQENISFLDRAIAETDINFKQIIPYQVLTSQNKYFVYRRGTRGGEDRLHAKLSLGIGGHLNKEDVKGIGDNHLRTYARGAERELYEEIEIGNVLDSQLIGMIYDDSNLVGQVHFGFCHLHTLEVTDYNIVDPALDAVGWLTYEELVDQRDSFESWSQIVIDNLLD